MTQQPAEVRATLLRVLLGAMFFVFAMTTDAVGSIIPTLIDEFKLSLSQASAFHYATMAAIAGGALAFGLLADRIGRKATIVIGLAAYAAASVALHSRCSSRCWSCRAPASACSRSARSRYSATCRRPRGSTPSR
jgi:fucose permease